MKEKNRHKEHDLEQEIEDAVEEEKEAEETEKEVEHQEIIQGIKQDEYEKKEKPKVEEKYKEEFKPEEYIENQEFYVKEEEDFDTIKKTIEEIKSQDPTIASVNDSDIYEIEPETRKLKLRRVPKTVLDRLKEKKIILDYYKEL